MAAHRSGWVAMASWLALTGSVAWGQAEKPTYDPRSAFTESDVNRDGQVDRVEYDQRMTEVYYHADVNKDGTLSATEAGATLVQTENIGVADTNRDGKLTLHEFTRTHVVDFEQTDTNDDGVLELDEVVTVYENDPKK
jgi:hypothetical protein